MDTDTIVQDESKVCAGAAPAPLDESLLLASADKICPGSIESSVLLGSPSIAVSADTVSYIDSHMHLDKLKVYSGCQDLTEMLKKGTQPDIQVHVEAIVANLCHGVPANDVKRNGDERIFRTHGIHPKRAHEVSREEIVRVKNAICSDERSVGIGEIGFDFSGGFKNHKSEQKTLLRDMVKFYSGQKLYNKTIVLHCRDRPGSSDAAILCQKVLSEEVPAFDKDLVTLHLHCFNNGLNEMRHWMSAFPRIRFGFTALLLGKNKHSELENVVKTLDDKRILLETDSPYLKPPSHAEHSFNTPYGLLPVARKVAELRGVSLRRLLEIANENAKEIYNLP